MSRMHRDRVKRNGRFRLILQLCAAALLNGYAAGFAKGKIFTGKTKLFCVPVLNCYSCPGALGACPIGAMQAVAGGKERSFSFYVLGVLMLFGSLFGRLLCGVICPFGLIQDLIAKIPLRKITVPVKADHVLRYLKYVILALMVVILPAAVTGPLGTGDPWFCKYLCPAGTLESGIPLVLLNPPLRKLAGALFSWKFAVMLAVLIGAVKIPRLFCRYLCPLGAFYALFNRFACYQMHVSKERCIGCGKCDAVCPMAVSVTEQINCGECIRCGKCKAVCPTDAISAHFLNTTREKSNQS
ncbi:MAG: 4Fe-4S binding protein [Oscillospiraceae bacterium]|nr:4Fe-4S binding protein [Oscillospiraceae bacterium]